MDTSKSYVRDGRIQQKPRGNYFLFSFLFGLALAFVIFVPFMIVDGGRFLFYGDFNVQQVPFYRIAHDAIRSGNIGWNHLTDLGVNFIGSYSFYLLGSPFFWLTIPFPGEWLQYLMGPLFILKFGCASLSGYIYLHRYAKNPNTALLASLLYAFSGYSIYNIFFNHFHEAIIVFPLLLAALDEYMYTKRRGIFALMVAAACIVNYYFFVGMVTFTVIYFFVRLLSGSWHITVKDFLLLALEAVLGLGIACILLVFCASFKITAFPIPSAAGVPCFMTATSATFTFCSVSSSRRIFPHARTSPRIPNPNGRPSAHGCPCSAWPASSAGCS